MISPEVFKINKNSFHQVEIGKAVPRVRKNNIQDEVKKSKIRINCQLKIYVLKKDFRYKFSLFNGFTQTPTPLTVKIC